MPKKSGYLDVLRLIKRYAAGITNSDSQDDTRSPLKTTVPMLMRLADPPVKLPEQQYVGHQTPKLNTKVEFRPFGVYF